MSSTSLPCLALPCLALCVFGASYPIVGMPAAFCVVLDSSQVMRWENPMTENPHQEQLLFTYVDAEILQHVLSIMYPSFASK